MTLLTPLAALVALAAVVPLAAWARGRRRAERVRQTLALPPPQARSAARPLAAAAAVALLGLAAAQPVLVHDRRASIRTAVEALFVFDTSRSMAASRTPTSPTRLDRAVAAATRLRAAIADVPSGVATLTDRVLPDLLPVPDVRAFDLVAQRGVAIESPPPADTSLRATTFGALAGVASGNYFAPAARRRLVVLLTDGESDPVDTAALAAALPPDRYRFALVRVWGDGEAVWRADGKPETAYRPDPLSRDVVDTLAAALDGRAYEESEVAAAARFVRNATETGPRATTATAAPGRTPLAPYVGVLAVLLLAASVVSLQKPGLLVQWRAS